MTHRTRSRQLPRRQVNNRTPAAVGSHDEEWENRELHTCFSRCVNPPLKPPQMRPEVKYRYMLAPESPALERPQPPQPPIRYHTPAPAATQDPDPQVSTTYTMTNRIRCHMPASVGVWHYQTLSPSAKPLPKECTDKAQGEIRACMQLRKTPTLKTYVTTNRIQCHTPLQRVPSLHENLPDEDMAEPPAWNSTHSRPSPKYPAPNTTIDKISYHTPTTAGQHIPPQCAKSRSHKPKPADPPRPHEAPHPITHEHTNERRTMHA
ncbi:hypothetical protein BS47DRAFT_1360428 [Hydnum rufescens UP504]|uniref:Uncharacterized protein n=1 Tax=Hydnum rufescens UP504 TaxID=1448309 RepID=A0A9P6DZ10_9AGAM|nr:hypothetical protein BS47DRAFT_1360428 [Hydnum rufescens UP504]